MKARNDEPVLIAGGGIGGLAAALALARKGFRSVVLEQAPQFGEIGAGIQLAPNAWHALDALGVGALVKKEAVFIERLLMFDGVSGERVIDIPLDERFARRFGNPYAVTHRADIHGSLLDGCKAAPGLIEGIELTRRDLLSAFERHKIAKVEPKPGDRFDPKLHQAMFEAPVPGTKAGDIIQVMGVGFTIGDRLLRPAQVGVSAGGPAVPGGTA